MLFAWIICVFLLQVPSGTVHLLYAGSVILFARRVLHGAPRFAS